MRMSSSVGRLVSIQDSSDMLLRPPGALGPNSGPGRACSHGDRPSTCRASTMAVHHDALGHCCCSSLPLLVHDCTSPLNVGRRQYTAREDRRDDCQCRQQDDVFRGVRLGKRFLSNSAQKLRYVYTSRRTTYVHLPTARLGSLTRLKACQWRIRNPNRSTWLRCRHWPPVYSVIEGRSHTSARYSGLYGY